VVVIARAGATTKVAARVAVPGVDAESVAVMVNVAVPAAVGVPEKTPAELSMRPLGSVPAVTVQVYGGVPPPAASVWL
jgi:hypothetical protein